MEPGSTTGPLVQKTWRDSLPIDMILSAVSVLVVAQSSSEIPEGLNEYPCMYVQSKLFERYSSDWYNGIIWGH